MPPGNPPERPVLAWAGEVDLVHGREKLEHLRHIRYCRLLHLNIHLARNTRWHETRGRGTNHDEELSLDGGGFLCGVGLLYRLGSEAH